MPTDQQGTPNRSKIRVLGTLLLVLALLAGPIWVEAIHLADPTYTYDRAEVAVSGDTIEYVGEDVPHDVALSEDILCTAPVSVRACYLERTLVGNQSAPADIYHRGPGSTSAIQQEYEYVRARQAIYRPTTRTNRSQPYVIEDGAVRAVPNASTVENPFYRVELTLTPVDPTQALDDVAVSVEGTDPVVREVVRTGSSNTHDPVAIPQTPVRADDGSYYRVYLLERQDPSDTVGQAVFLLRFVAPLLGLALSARLLNRLEIRFTGGAD